MWVNEEDQLRIISMQNGADIGAVFRRLATAAAAIEKVARFSHNNQLGYITSCPTNLGTALRASVHIALPNLGQRKQEFEAIGLSARSDGDVTALIQPGGSIYDISILMVIDTFMGA